MTLIEVLITITLLAVVGGALLRLLTSQIRFADSDIAAKDARDVSRLALNALATDVRMVDADSGIAIATPDSFVVLAPYALGLVCGPGAAGGSVISLLPYDSAAYAEGGYAGYAYIDTTTSGTSYSKIYQYVYSATAPTTIDSATAVTTAPCLTATNRVSVFRVGAVTVTPAIPDRSRYQAAILFRQVVYSLKSSTTMSGYKGMFRRVVGGARGEEEIVAPFDASATFNYYLRTGAKVSSAAGANRPLIRGIELQLNGTTTRVVAGTTRKTAPMTTAIFFKNRPLQ